MDNYTEPLNYTQCIDPVEYARTSLQDSSTKPLVQFAFGLLYTIIFILGVGGNTLVILSVYKHKSLHSVRNTFIVSLSCSDIAVCLTSVLTTPIYSFVKIWLFGEIMCHVIPLFQGMSICISTFTLSAVAIDRYILIIHPTKTPIQKAHAISMIIFIWLMAASISVPISVNSRYFYYGPEPIVENVTGPLTPCGYYCIEDWGSLEIRKFYGTSVLVLTFILPLTVIGLSYTTIYYKLTKGTKLMTAKQSVASASASGRDSVVTSITDRQKSVLRRKQRTNRMLICMVFAFALSWLLQVLNNVLNDYKLLPQFIIEEQYSFGLLFHSIAMTSTCWNPILYAGMNEQYRSAFVQLLPCLKWFCKGGANRRPNGGSFQNRRLLSNAYDCADGPTTLNSDEFNTRRSSPPKISPATVVTEFKYEKNGGGKNGAIPVVAL